MDRKVTVQEVADAYHIGVRTVWRYLHDGRLTRHRVGPKMIRLDPQEVAQALGSPWPTVDAR